MYRKADPNRVRQWDEKAAANPEESVPCGVCGEVRWHNGEELKSCQTGCGRVICFMCYVDISSMKQYCGICRNGVTTRSGRKAGVEPKVSLHPSLSPICLYAFHVVSDLPWTYCRLHHVRMPRRCQMPPLMRESLR